MSLMSTGTQPELRSPELSELEKRMQKPQRHRLLHGYPLAAAMPQVPEKLRVADSSFQFSPDSNRGLLVGVLPHSFCNPKIRGCGFCTFPQEKYSNLKAATVVRGVIQEIDQRLEREPHFHGRAVAGIYLGGGTANLTPEKPFRNLCRKLNDSFDLHDAEVTLEGVPIHFIRRQPQLIDVMREELNARHFRISMGLQTFEERRLEQMGRLAFGTRSVFEEVVEQAHQRGFTISADLLFNLPGQTADEMHQDVSQAMEIGLDHVGLYHLVAFRGLGSVWSQDETMLAGLPTNELAVENWMTLQALLCSNGFHQTSLTNFERDEFDGTDLRYQYEEFSYRPNEFEMLAFGPSGISFATHANFMSGWKTTNPVASADYLQSVQAGGLTADRYFQYSSQDLRIFYLTRRLADLTIDLDTYQTIFATELSDDFPEELEALKSTGLLFESRRTLRPTARGMFFADSVAALFAWRRLSAMRKYHRRSGGVASATLEAPTVNDNGHGHM